MKFAAIAAAISLSLSACSGFNKPLKSPSMYETHDSEFLYWCMGDGIWEVYVESPDQCRPEMVSRGEWDHLPVVVNAEESLSMETIVAIDSFNDQLGFQMFKYEAGNMDPDIAVMVYGKKPWVAAEAKNLTVDGVRRGAVLVYNGMESKDREDIMLHELGHLVGLRHDRDNKHSIMYPTVAYRVARLERSDVEALQQVYLGR